MGIALYAFASSSGPNGTQTVVDDSSTGTVAWSNPMNATTSDGVYANAILPSISYTTHYLKATNFGFSLPISSTINGILVEIEKKENNGSQTNCSRDNIVSIVKSNGTIGAVNKADTVDEWPLTDTYKSYGSLSDLWGETWTSSDINNSNFGVVLSGTGLDCGGTGSITQYVDYIRITVYYTPASTSNYECQILSGQLQVRSGKFSIQ